MIRVEVTKHICAVCKVKEVFNGIAINLVDIVKKG